MLNPPNEKTLEQLPPLVRHEFSLRDGVKTDIVFSGLGWVAIHGKAVASRRGLRKGSPSRFARRSYETGRPRSPDCLIRFSPELHTQWMEASGLFGAMKR